MIVSIQTGESTSVNNFISRELSADALTKGFEYDPIHVTSSIVHEKQLIAGLIGTINWEWMYIEKLVVVPGHRQCGLGAKLIESALQFAAENNCKGIWVDTFTFQSPEFYLKRGFREFGRLRHYPGQQDRIFYRRFL